MDFPDSIAPLTAERGAMVYAVLMIIGLLGATGPAGTALAARLASVGHEVLLGSRSRYRSLEERDKIVERWPDHDLRIQATDNQEAAQAELVAITTPWDAAASTAYSVVEHLHGKVVICMSNALALVHGEFQPLVPPRGSVAASVQVEVPDAFVAATLQHVPAAELGNLAADLVSDVLICSDHKRATEAVCQLLSKFPGVRPLDAGGLSNAMAIEAFTAVLLQLNTKYKTRVAVRFTGIGDQSDQK
ncbi:MAG: NADPH-dependent F420 reductase [Acidimicrobiales bacterium]